MAAGRSGGALFGPNNAEWHLPPLAEQPQYLVEPLRGGPTWADPVAPLQLLRRYPLLCYFLIAYAFTWTYDLLFLVLFPLPDVLGRTTPRDFGPSVAALIMTAALAGKPGLRRFFRRLLLWRVPVVW